MVDCFGLGEAAATGLVKEVRAGGGAPVVGGGTKDAGVGNPGVVVEKVVEEAKPGGGAMVPPLDLLLGTGSERNSSGRLIRLKFNFLKSAAGGVVSRRQILELFRKDSKKVA